MSIRLSALPQATILSPTDSLYGIVGGNSRRVSTSALMGRNLIINGQGRVNQRRYTSGLATTIVNQYTLDRWRLPISGQSLTFTGNESRRIMTAPAGGAEQVIEGRNIVGGTYVLNWTGTATATVNGVARSKGAAFTLTANTNATVRFTNGTFTDVQLELGSLCTPFEWNTWDLELAKCQRYQVWWIGDSGPADYVSIGSGHVASTTTDCNILVPMPVTPRGVPAFSFAGILTILDGSAGATVLSIVNAFSGTGGSVWLTVRGNTSLTTGRGCILYTQNNEANRFRADMEIYT